ncbi:MAG: lysine transporter LysE, partial [Chloroflexota bacterium]
YIAGGLFVLYLARGAYRQWKSFSPQADQASAPGPESLWRAALVNALSPGPYLFWSLVNGPLLIRAWRETPPNAGGFLLGFYGGMIGLNAAIILVFGLASQLGDRVRRAMLGVSALALAGFGLYQLWLGVSTF